MIFFCYCYISFLWFAIFCPFSSCKKLLYFLEWWYKFLIFFFPVLAACFFLWRFVFCPYISEHMCPCVVTASSWCIWCHWRRYWGTKEFPTRIRRRVGWWLLCVVILICSTWGRVINITECHSVERPNTMFGKSTCFVHWNTVFEICFYCSRSISWMLKVLPAFLTIQSLHVAESWGIWKEYRLRHQEAVICGFCMVGKIWWWRRPHMTIRVHCLNVQNHRSQCMKLMLLLFVYLVFNVLWKCAY